MAIESTPDSGVAIRNDAVAPSLAPWRFSDAAAGSTPQEQRGIGMPSSAALITLPNRPSPRWRATVAGERKILSKPPTMMPKRT